MEAPAGGTGYICRHCLRPAQWAGNPQTVTGRALAKTLHTDTGQELCEDGENFARPMPARRQGER